MESTTLAERLREVPVAGRPQDPSVRRWIGEVAPGHRDGRGPAGRRALPPALEPVLADAAVRRCRTAGELARAVVGAFPGEALPPPPRPARRVPRPSARRAGAAAAPVPGDLGAPVRVGGLTLTVLSVDTGAAPPSSVRARGGDRFVAVRVACRSAGAGAMPASPYDWVVVDAAADVNGHRA